MVHSDGAWEVIKEGIAPSDISQGELGNCWFLSALAVLAEIPELIENILMNHTYNTAGVYQVRLCKDGIWKVVTIDDYFPITSSGHLAYGKSNGPELWVAIIEKAYAKLHGSYAAIESGQMHDAFQDLTGAPCTTIRFETGTPDIDMIW
jgi:calpain-15